MARKTSNLLTRQTLWKLWQFLGTENWLALLNKHKGNNQFIGAGPGILKGLCVHPDHHDTAPSFYINVEKGFAKCYGGSCNYYESDPLQLLAYVMGCSKAEALTEIQNQFKPPFIPKKATEILEKQRKNQQMKQEVFRTTRQLMCNALATPDDPDYAYATTTLDWLINKRKIPQDVLHTLPIAVMPELGKLSDEMIDRYVAKTNAWNKMPPAQRGPEPEDYSTLATEYFMPYVRNTTFQGAVLFPMHVTPREIGKFKLRAPNRNDSKDITIPDDAFEDSIGLYGLGWEMYKPFLGKGTKNGTAVLTEGEFDVLSLMARWAQSGKVAFPLLGVGGAGGADCIETVLPTAGVATVHLVGDAPDKSGDDVVQKWLERIQDMRTQVFDGWDLLAPAKDLDDAAIDPLIGPDKLEEVLFHNDKKTFVPVWRWAYGKAEESINALGVDDFRARIEAAAEHGRYLRNRLERTKFTEEIERQFNLNGSLLRREMSARNDTEEGFVTRCGDALREMLFVVGTRSVNNVNSTVLYDKKFKRFHTIKLDSESAIVQELTPLIGALTRFVDNHVGRPPFMEWPGETEGLVLKKVMGQLKTYMSNALVDLTEGTHDVMQATRYKQGYHSVVTGDGEACEFIVCGTDIIKITRNEDTGITYSALEGPAYKDLVFDVGLMDNDSKQEAWYPDGITPQMLRGAGEMSLGRLYDDLVTMYSTAYRFRNHDITSELLAALMLIYPIMDVFKKPIVLFVSGDTSSGKTSLLSSFSNLGYEGIRLLFASQGADTFTAAGVAGMMDSDSRLLALDEFEGGDTERGMHASKISEMIRPLVSGQATRTKARPDGSSVSQSFRLPIILAAIQGAERPQDLNRMLSIEMKKQEFKVDPMSLIGEMFSDKRWDEMRQGINLGMYAHAPRLREMEKEVSNEFQSIQKELGVKMEWRLASSLFAPMALLKYMGRDYKDFFRRYVEENKYTISRVTTVSETSSVLTSIMHHHIIPQTDGPPMSMAQLLVVPERREEINTANKGVFYDSVGKLLLVLVNQGMMLLPYHFRKSMNANHFRNLLERHPTALKPHEIESTGIMRRIGRMGAGIELQEVIVLNVSNWLNSTSAQTPVQTTEEAGTTQGENDGNITEESTEEESVAKEKDASDFGWD